MTTKEKATEIAESYVSAKYRNQVENRITLYQIKSGCLKMAQWEKQQIVDATVEWLCLNFIEDGRTLRHGFRTLPELISEYVNDINR